MIDINFLREAYFTFDLPVDYQLKNGATIKIYPIMLIDSTNFLMSIDILTVDKNSFDSVEIIQKSYLQFLIEDLLKDERSVLKLKILLKLCLHINGFKIVMDERNRPAIFCSYDNDNSIIITHKDFEQIKKIICYQNLLRFDDEYIPPDLKQSMQEVDELKNRGIEPPSLERRIGIITSHCGLSKDKQMQMTLRSHSVLFEEVSNEVEYMGIKAIATYGGKGDEVQWIYRKSKSKYDGYFTSDEKYSRSMGGSGHVNMTNTNIVP